MGTPGAQVVINTREGKRFQAFCPPWQAKRPRGGESQHQCAGTPTTPEYFRLSASGIERQGADALPFDAVADYEHHRPDGARRWPRLAGWTHICSAGVLACRVKSRRLLAPCTGYMGRVSCQAWALSRKAPQAWTHAR